MSLKETLENKAINLFLQKRDGAEVFTQLLDALESALATTRPDDLMTLCVGRNGKQDTVTGELVGFHAQLMRLPTDDPRVQPWSQLYMKGRQLHAQALVRLHDLS